MKFFAIVNQNGEPIDVTLRPEDVAHYCDIDSLLCFIELPYLIDRQELLKQYYWKDQWKIRQPRKSKHHYWDNDLEIWIPNLDEAKRAKKDDVNAIREEKLKNDQNGINYKNYNFSNNSTTRANITEALSLVNAGVPVPDNFAFRTSDNINVPFNSEDIKNLSTLSLFYKNSCYKHSWELKEQIETLTTVEEVEAFDITIGWP